VRLRYPNANYRPFHQLLETTPEIVEAHHVTGEDCFVLTMRPGPCAISRRSPAGSTGSVG
jgi:Lrp/AsnC family leucine-responsive transcriptional regulator